MAKWTGQDELRLQQETRSRKPDWAELSRALGRSERAIKAKARRMGLLKPSDAYAPGELAHMLGVSTGTLASWRKTGLLKSYTRRHVRAFLWRHADVLGTGRVDLVWLVDVLIGGKSGRAA